jgi:hypothetical protein
MQPRRGQRQCPVQASPTVLTSLRSSHHQPTLTTLSHYPPHPLLLGSEVNCEGGPYELGLRRVGDGGV